MSSPATMAYPGRGLDLDAIAEELHRGFGSASFPVFLAQRTASLSLGWEIFDDPHRHGKILVVRFLDADAHEGARLAGKLTAAIRPWRDGGILVDCSSPFHGVSLRPAYQRHGVVGSFLRVHLLGCLPSPCGVTASVGQGTATAVALEFFRAYMEQRRGPEWLATSEGRRWWRSLPENDAIDWDAAGGYPPLFALLRNAGCRLLLEDGRVLAIREDAPDA